LRAGLAAVMLGTLATPAIAVDTMIADGRALVDLYCSSCHAIGPAGGSPHREAPPFRELHLRYEVDWLAEALVEGLVTGHPDMPEFEFDPVQAEAIIAYLKTLE
jgi:mono/diheme cytochrome c family protein